jgi:tetratricopeptide (TPR) repeat protein
MSFFQAKTRVYKKWCGAVICLLTLVLSTGCATTELMPDDNKVLAKKKFREALQTGSLNQQDKIMTLLKEALELNPADPNFHFFLGRTYFAQGILGRAEQEFLESIKLNNNFKGLLSTAGFDLHATGALEKGNPILSRRLETTRNPAAPSGL